MDENYGASNPGGLSAPNKLPKLVEKSRRELVEETFVSLRFH